MHTQNTVAFVVEGAPVPKSRPRFGKGRTFTPRKTKEYEERVRTAFTAAADAAGVGMIPAGVPAYAIIRAYFPTNKSDSKKTIIQKLSGLLRPTKRPDVDNIIKVVLDALNAEAWQDDAQVVDVRCTKDYSSRPRVAIEVGEVVVHE